MTSTVQDLPDTTRDGTPPLPDDLAISRAVRLRPPAELAAELGLPAQAVLPFGRGVAKVDPAVLDLLPARPQARYVLVSAITPTPAGEGKTTVAVGLAQGLRRLGRRAVVTLRQPSLGPTFGIKGGGAGGGHSQVVPMDTVNLHLTGDGHAVTAAHDLLAAMVDNSLHHGNPLGIDPRSVSWRRVLDVDDRALRSVVVGLGGRSGGVPRQTGFDITAASEVMAVLALATSRADLRARLGRIVVAQTFDGAAVTAEDLRAAGAMAALLRDAVMPNLLQTVEGVPAFVHAGPFGNIATGNSSVLADLVAARTAEFLVTEAGFGADLGAERFVDIKCRVSGLRPHAAVLVATVRALKVHSGQEVPGTAERPDLVLAGTVNLVRQLEILRGYGLPTVVAVNAFPSDHASEHEAVRKVAEAAAAPVAVVSPALHGGAGVTDLARLVAEAAAGSPGELRPVYPLEASLRDKLTMLARDVYGADGIEVSPAAAGELERLHRLGHGRLPVCVAKTHLSLSADPRRTGAPTGWRLPVREVRLAAGAGYVYAICGDMFTMPGLPRRPAAERVDVDADGEVVGLR